MNNLSTGDHISDRGVTSACLCAREGGYSGREVVSLCREQRVQSQVGEHHGGRFDCNEAEIKIGKSTNHLTWMLRTQCLDGISTNNRTIIVKGNDTIMVIISMMFGFQSAFDKLKQRFFFLYSIDYYLSSKKPMTRMFRIGLT